MPCEYQTQTFKSCRCSAKWQCQCLIRRKKTPGPPFNSSSERDAKIGLHPKLYSYKSDSPVVGTYDVSSIKRRSITRDWNKELKSEEFSATMGGKLLEKYTEQRNLMKTGRGPGTHEISQWPENILERPCTSLRRDVGFGTVSLSKHTYISTIPGPGYTRKNPYYYIDKRRKDGLSALPTFEYDGMQPRFRKISKSWSLPCNLYDVKRPDTLEAVLNKVTGKRGPYDLFTGPRDDSTIKNHFATVKLEDRGNWPRPLPSELDKLLHKSNYFKGRWIPCPRFPKSPGIRMVLKDLALCYKDPNHPGPGHYDPKLPKKPQNMKNYPFNMNVEFIRPVTLTLIRPGPGRYDTTEKKCIKGNGWTHVFDSKSPRTNFIFIPKYNAF